MEPSDFCSVDSEPGMFCFTSSKYWDEEGVLDDQLTQIDCLPFGFENAMEATWEFYDAKLNSNLTKIGKKKTIRSRIYLLGRHEYFYK